MRIVEIEGKKILVRTRRKFRVFLIESFRDYSYIVTGPREDHDFLKTIFPPDLITLSPLQNSIFSWTFLHGILELSRSVPDDGYSANYFTVSGHLSGTEGVFKELRKLGYRALIGNVIR